MSEFLIPDKALAALRESAASDELADRDESTRTQVRIGGYAGFVCCHCRRPVDEYVRGDHDPDCPNKIHNQSLLPGAEAFADRD